MSLLWMCASEPYVTQRRPAFLAELIGFEYAGSAEVRAGAQEAAAVMSSLRELQDRGFVVVQPGDPAGDAPPLVSLMAESLVGKPYSIPDGRNESYIRVPDYLWTSGTLARLTAPGLAMYLVMLDMAGPEEHEFKLSRTRVTNVYGFSDATRKRGLRELELCKVVGVERKRTSADEGPRREENRYLLSYNFSPLSWQQ